MFKNVLILLFFLAGQMMIWGQVSPECVNAIPICYNTPINGGTIGYGTDDFNGAASTGCLEQTSTTGVIESNSAWYRFRANVSGQLGFNIGHDASEDWDFALYQTSDCSNLGEPVRCNFFDNRDENSFIGVGEDPSGDSETLQYTEWLMVEPGQDFYLLINNFSDTNSGFSIQFSGNIFETNPYDALDCSVINNLLGPPLAVCSNETVLLDATTTNALSYVWYQDIGNGFEEIMGETNPTYQPLQSAMYRVLVVTNDEQIISEVQVAFSTAPVTNVVSDEITCENEIGFDLSTKDAEALGSQDPNNYLVTYYASQDDAEMGNNELPKQYVSIPGIEHIYIRVTSIQNPNCSDVSSTFELNTIASPILGTDQEVYLCDNLESMIIGEDIANGDYEYSWNTGETGASITVSEAGTYVLTATTSLGSVFCVRTKTFTVIRTPLPEILEVQIGEYGFSNMITVVTEIEGDFEYKIDEGEFQNSPVFEGVLPGSHTVYMRDLNGCGLAIEDIAVVGYLPYFSPNGDGINDNWHIVGIEHLNEPLVSIFDRYGKPITVLHSNSPGWNGTQNGEQLPGSDYWFYVSFLNANGNRVKAKFLENHFSLRR